MNDKLKRLIATAVASLGLFAFAACDTVETETDTDNDTANSSSIDNDTTGNENKDDDTTGGDEKDPDGGDDEGENKKPNEGGDEGEGFVKPADPVIPTVPAGAVQITKAAGDLEAAYATWNKVDGAMGYNVYYKIDGGNFVKLDAPLVREYKNYCRADALGLKAGKYTLKVVPTGGANYAEDEDKAATVTDITVLAHERSGYAFVGGTASGAYNEDGTLKSDADVVYVTDATKDTVSRNGVKGIQNILDGQKKAGKPLAIRLIGNITSPDITESKANNNNKNPNTLLVKGDGRGGNLAVTLEGVGSDATANGWTLRVTSSTNVEVRNIGFMNTQASEPDDITLEKDDHIWVHNCDLFYGGAGSDNDQAKGDGALDTKESTNITHSYNHFWDSGKCNLQGMKSEATTNYITYHHNWYDHSDSRHPRIRTCTTHIYNNYFDGNAKYGVGVTKDASAFVENNYFRSTATMTPMMSSMQGTDALGEGTFSSEDGGMIKAYGNKFDGKYRLITQNDTADKTNLDCYLASSRNETVPAEYTAKKGGASYSNFDTASDFYKYTVDTPDVAKEKVEAYAGRVDGGDFKWEFNDATEDSNYAVIKGLKSALVGYTSDLVKAGGEAVTGSSGSTTGGEGGNETGGDDDTGTTVPEGVSKVEFIAANAGKYPAGITVSGNYKDGKGNLKMEAATTVTVKVEKDTVITVKTTGSSSQGIKLNGTKTSLNSSGECQITVQAGATLTITKGDTMELVYILLN